MASNNHRLILGKSGYGKTWCCYRMIEEAVEQKKKCVIFDYSGSYTMEEQERSKFASRDQTYVFDGNQPGITYWYTGKNVYSAFEEALIVALPFRGHRTAGVSAQSDGTSKGTGEGAYVCFGNIGSGWVCARFDG